MYSHIFMYVYLAFHSNKLLVENGISYDKEHQEFISSFKYILF